MALDHEALANALGVEPDIVRAVARLEDDAIEENLGGIAVRTVHSHGKPMRAFDPAHATNTLLGLRNTDWEQRAPDERVTAAVFYLERLGELGIHLFQQPEDKA